jgi:WD40 repeat protein
VASIRLKGIERGELALLLMLAVCFTPTGILTQPRNGPRAWRTTGGERTVGFSDGSSLPTGAPQFPRSRFTRIEALAFSGDGSLLAAEGLYRGENGPIRVWNLAGDRLSAEILVPDLPATWTLALSPDGTLVAAGGLITLPFQWKVEVWKVATQGMTANLAQEAGPLGTPVPMSLAFSRDGKYLAAGVFSSLPGTKLKVWETGSWKAIRDLFKDPGGIFALAFSPEGRLAAQEAARAPVLPFRGPVITLDVTAGKRVAEYKYKGCGPVGRNLLTFSPDGTMLAAGTKTEICVWDVASRKKNSSLRTERRPVAIAFSSDGGSLISTFPDGSVRRWDLKGGSVTSPCTVGDKSFFPHPATFSEDGRMLAWADKDGRTVHILDTESCAELHKFTM